MKKYQQTLPYLILLPLMSIPLFLYGYLGSFTRFIADDYCSAYYARELGLVNSILYWYRTWSGRYSAFGMDWLVLTKLLDVYHLKYVPPVSLVLWIAFTSAVVFMFMKNRAPQKEVILPAIVLAMSFLYGILILSPKVPQSLYWWNGMRSYSLPLVVLTIYAFLFKLVLKGISTRKQVFIWGLVSICLLFASGGLGETYSVMQFSLLIFLIILKIASLPDKRADPELILLVGGLLGSIASLSVIISAPGNAIRQSHLNSSPNLVNLLQISLSGYKNFWIDSFGQIDKLTGLLGILLLAIWLGMKYKHVPLQSWKLLAFFFGGFALSFACILPGVYGYSQFPPARTLILSVFVLLLCLLHASFLGGGWLSPQTGKFQWARNALIALTSVLLLISTVTTSLSLYHVRDTYIAFAEKWDRVDAQILQAKANGQKFVEIPAMSNWAGLDRPNQYQEFWATECYTNFYEIEVYGPPY